MAGSRAANGSPPWTEKKATHMVKIIGTSASR